MFSHTVSSSKCGKEASPPPILRFRSAGLLNQPRDNSPLEGRVEIACESPKYPLPPAAALDRLVGWHLAVRLDAVLEAEELPASIADLHAALPAARMHQLFATPTSQAPECPHT